MRLLRRRLLERNRSFEINTHTVRAEEAQFLRGRLEALLGYFTTASGPS